MQSVYVNLNRNWVEPQARWQPLHGAFMGGLEPRAVSSTRLAWVIYLVSLTLTVFVGPTKSAPFSSK